MENYNINLTVIDTAGDKCSTNTKETTTILTNSNNFVNLQCGFSLKIEKVTTTYIIISINNLILHVIRQLYVNIPIWICLCDKNNEYHRLRIILNSIQIL